MIVELLRETLFTRKLDDDVRSIETHSLFSLDFQVPSALLAVLAKRTNTNDDGDHAKANANANATTETILCALLPPDFGFYYQLVAIVLLQSVFNVILGAFVYKIIIEPRRQRQQRNKAKAKAMDTEHESNATPIGNSNSNKIYYSDDLSSGTAALFAFGIAMPCVILEPIYAIRAFEIRNVGLIMVFLATPIVNSLRITEALSGFAPIPSQTSLRNYVAYFSCLFGMEFDPSTGTPKRVTQLFFRKRLATLGRDFVIVSLLISFLKPYEFEFFDSSSSTIAIAAAAAAPVNSVDHTLLEMLSWKHLLNNFLVAFLISASLSQSSLGVSLVYNIIYGVQTYEVVLNPMLKSTSPSDFWGRRWNMLVHRGLKNGIYKPTRKHTSSKLLAVVATFVVSGIIHEYVNYAMFTGQGSSNHDSFNDHEMLEASAASAAVEETYEFTWKQMLFFGWNGVLILLEYCIGHWAIFRWMSRTLPPIVVTALVLCCALPLAHFFTGDWIKHGYFDAVLLAEPIVVCSRRGE